MMKARNHLNKKLNKVAGWIVFIYIFSLTYQPFQISSQLFYNLNEHYFLKAKIGGTTFFGDLSKDMKMKLMLGGQLSKKLGPSFIGSGQVLFGDISGQDIDLDMYFNAQILDMNVGLGLDLTQIFLGSKSERKYYIYGSGGAGLAAFWSAKRDILTNNIIQSKGYESGEINYSDPTVERVIFIELGMHYHLNDKWDLSISQTFRTIDTDKLDAHYDNSNSLEGYFYFSLGIAFNFNLNIFPSFEK
ncbi:hypothetical protein ACFLRZ_05820, partial [Bacteroidota bacterium]